MIEKILDGLSHLFLMLPNLLLAALIVALGVWIMKALRRYAKKRILNYFPTKSIGNLTISVLYVAGLVVFILIALQLLNLDKAITTALAGAGIVGVALAFAFQDIASNFMSGILLAFRKPFIVGDTVEVGNTKGIVLETKLRDTTIKTFQGQHIIVPNKEIFQNTITNYSVGGQRRADIKGGVSYNTDLRKAQKVALKALENISGVTGETTVLFDEFDGSSINFTIRIRLDDEHSILEFTNDVVIAIQKAFDTNDISMPFPITTLDFGIDGGVELAEQLQKK